MLSTLRSSYPLVVILKGISVDYDNRGQGVGTRLLKELIDEAIGNYADAVLLECDLDEDNDFPLKEWYESFDFEVLAERGNPLMVLNLK